MESADLPTLPLPNFVLQKEKTDTTGTNFIETDTPETNYIETA